MSDFITCTKEDTLETQALTLRKTVRTLTAAVETAVNSGSWIVDSENDPNLAMIRLNSASLSGGNFEEYANLTMDLVESSIKAIDEGAWQIQESDIYDVMNAGAAARNFLPTTQEVTNHVSIAA
jgi:hypothetical protein